MTAIGPDGSPLEWGDRARVACGATGRYVGSHHGVDWVLWVSAQDNDLMLTPLDPAGEPQPSLPVPSDDACAGAAAALCSPEVWKIARAEHWSDVFRLG